MAADYIRTFCRPGRELTSKLSEEGFFLITVSITLILWPLWPEKLAQEVVLAPRQVLIEEFTCDRLPVVVSILLQALSEGFEVQGVAICECPINVKKDTLDFAQVR